MQSEGSQKENLNRIITVPNLLSFFRFCLIPVIIWSYCVKENPLLAGEILLLSGLTDLVYSLSTYAPVDRYNGS